jgi:hypothetical protein
MELIGTALMIVICVVWFFDSLGKNRDRDELLRSLDEAEEAACQRESVYREGLRAKRDAGDQQAAALLRWHGWA